MMIRDMKVVWVYGVCLLRFECWDIPDPLANVFFFLNVCSSLIKRVSILSPVGDEAEISSWKNEWA